MRWTKEKEEDLINEYVRAAAQSRNVASGGKNLRKAGWTLVKNAMLAKYPTDGFEAAQLAGKWKRLKGDWSDYHFLINLSGFGEDFGDQKWDELDSGRAPGASKLSRFKNVPFAHYEKMFPLLNNTMATGAFVDFLINDTDY